MEYCMEWNIVINTSEKAVGSLLRISTVFHPSRARHTHIHNKGSKVRARKQPTMPICSSDVASLSARPLGEEGETTRTSLRLIRLAYRQVGSGWLLLVPHRVGHADGCVEVRRCRYR